MSVNHLIRDVIELLQPEFTAKLVTVRSELTDALPSALADPIHVEQVVLNLARNAAEAMSQTPVPRELIIRTRVDDDGYIEVAVQDNGPRLSEAVMRQVFSPFFTTKENGIDMGLSISRSIIEAHDGRIDARNNPCGGACFSFTLPASVNMQNNYDKPQLHDRRRDTPPGYQHGQNRRSHALARENQ